MLHTKFHGNWPAGSKGRFLKGFYYIWASSGSHLCHMTSIMPSDFHFLVLESFHTKFGSDQHSSF